MSTPRERIDALGKQIKELEDKAADLQASAFKLRTEREELIAEMILSEGLLSETDWSIRLNGETNPYLEYSGDLNLPNIDELLKVARADWHCWFELTDGVRLQFDDNDISLTFQEPKQLMPFVKKNKLKVSGTGITDKLAKLKREVSALEDVCHTFKL